MTAIVVRVIDVYPYRMTARGPEFLLLRRAPGTAYAGAWRMVGGKIESGEAAWQAAVRELREETAFEPVRLWSVPSVNLFHEWREDRVNVVPAFAAEVAGEPVLDDEHDAHRWAPPDTAADLVDWPEQARLLRLAASVLAGGIPPDLVVDND